MINLGPRLSEIALRVPKNGLLIDVGCDHGLLPVALLQSNHIKHAYAVDINVSPLEKAQKLAIDHAIAPEHFEAIRSDGLTSFDSLDGKTIVIAGMGGGRISRILRHASPDYSTVDTLILQPNTDATLVRSSLDQMGLTIVDEVLCQEKRTRYVIIVAKPISPYKPLTEREKYLGPILMRRQTPEFRAQCTEYADFLTTLKEKLGSRFPKEKSTQLQWLNPYAY